MEFEQSVIDAVQEVFSTMIMLDAVPGAPIRDSKESLPANVSGSLGFAGDVTGALVVHCPADTAKAITGAFLGMEVEELDDDVKDAIGELANMVAGGFKDTQSRSGVSLSISIPTTVIGTGYRISGVSRAQRTVIPFSCDNNEFWVELRYQKNQTVSQ